MNNNIIIQVQNLSKSYKLYNKPIDRMKEALSLTQKNYHKEFFALKDVSFEVYKGETVGIIGTNGAGKSTLLKIITRVTSPSVGSVVVNGRVSALLELGAGFNPEYTGMQNIYLNGAMIGYSKQEMDIKKDPILKFADIGDFINQPVKNYSSGMFARLAFAVAINVEPDILIVDEALSVGDTFFQNKCYRKFDDLKRRGTTILFVSHDTNSVKQMCSRALWLESGVQQMFGESGEVCNAYSNSIRKKSGIQPENIQGTEAGYQLKNDKKIELSRLPELQYSKESQLSNQAKILGCYFEDENGEKVIELVVDRRYKFVSIFKAQSDIEQCITGFVIESLKGQWIINCNSAITGQKKPFHVSKGQTVCSEFDFVMPKLFKGDYIVGTAVSNGEIQEFEVLTWLYQVLKVTVYNPGANASVVDVDCDVEIVYL